MREPEYIVASSEEWVVWHQGVMRVDSRPLLFQGILWYAVMVVHAGLCFPADVQRAENVSFGSIHDSAQLAPIIGFVEIDVLYRSTGVMIAWEAGPFMLVWSLVQVLVTIRAGAMFDRLPDKRMVPVFAADMMTIGVVRFLFLDTDMNILHVAVLMVVLSVGLGYFAAPVNTVMVNRWC